MKWSKLWGPIVGLEALGAVLGFLSYHWIHSQPLLTTVWPWVLARAAGLAAFALLTVLVILGLGMSHPAWKRLLSRRFFAWHRALALGVFVLVAIHGISLVLDRYAGVGWAALVVPGLTRYRPIPVAFGVVAAELLALMAVSAHLAKNWGRLKWMTLHRWAAVTWVLVLGHSIWSGTDSQALSEFYYATAIMVGVASLLRYGMAKAESRGGQKHITQ